MSEDAWGLLARQSSRRFGCFTVEQARRAGIAATDLARKREAGTVTRVHRGVYRFNSVPDGHRAQVLAAVYAACPGAVASHTTAAALWELGDLDLGRPYHLLVVGRCQRSLDRVVVHEAGDLDRLDTTRLGPIPITAVRRTIVDVAALVPVAVLEDLVVEAQRRSLADIAGIEAALSLAPSNCAGTSDLRRMLRSMRPEEIQRLMSRLEAHFLRLVHHLGLPAPEVNRRIVAGGKVVAKVDFIWPSARLIVEVDGLRWHSTPSQKAYDDDRQNELVLRGYRVLRFGARRILGSPERVGAQIRAALEASTSPVPYPVPEK
ncbi:MAG: type IV toxin-antitoxin system AbiEi family antitoxin domain-containing protein [Nitriliruptorales bacterium]